MAYHTIFFSIGFLLLALAGAMLPPALLDWYYGDTSWLAFAKAFPFTILVALMLIFGFRPAKIDLDLKDAFFLTFLAWIIVVTFAALPFAFSDPLAPVTHAYFESISALTTTGATLMKGLDYASRGILLWRAILQWLGGIGILMMALVIMPALRIGGMQLFRTDFSDRSEKIYPKLSQITQSILSIYLTLTVLCGFFLWLFGMPLFDAVCYSFSTLSTGGFSTSDDSISLYRNPYIEGTLMVFMLCGATTLLLFARFFKGDFRAFMKDEQFRTFMKLIAFFGIGLSAWFYSSGYNLSHSLHNGFFHVISMISTTGYHNGTLSFYESFPAALFFILTQIGGCTGSTTGSTKVFRFIILFTLAKAQLKHMLKPHSVFIARYQGKQISENVFFSVMTFFAFYVLSLAVTVFALSLCDLDLFSCLSSSVAALTNAGVGFGSLVGHVGNFHEVNVGAKWVLMWAMLVGRLEYVILFIMISRSFWRR